MKRIVLLLFLGIGLSACTATGAASRELPSVEPGRTEPVHREHRFLGTMSEALSDHFSDCAGGFAFTFQSMGDQTTEDWNRMIRSFR